VTDTAWARSPLLDQRRLRGGSHVEDAAVVALARLLTDPEGFAAREAAARAAASHEAAAHEAGGHAAARDERLGTYRLRDSGLELVLRHGTPDVGVLDEVFGQRQYDPPPPVAAVLDERSELEVVDLGANIGLFALHARARWPAAHITSFEPDPCNLELLERCHGANADRGPWRLVAAAAAVADGEQAFHAGRFACSALAAEGEAPAENRPPVRVPAVDALPALAGADLVKMDIEGGEWALLGDPRFAAAGVRAVVLEHHPHLCPGPDPRAAAEGLLHAAGYATRSLIERPDRVGLLWAWRTL